MFFPEAATWNEIRVPPVRPFGAWNWRMELAHAIAANACNIALHDVYEITRQWL